MKVNWNRIKTNYIFPCILALLPLLQINQGVDITDTGYSLGNFRFLEELEGMWYIATYLANVVGVFFSKLPFGNTMMGMNFYTGLLVSAMSITAYFFFLKRMSPWIVFLGEVMALSLCWCPTVILYNYMTYLFLLLGALCLYEGLTEDKKYFFVLAGILLGMNVTVRMPNVTQASLILAVWYYGYLKKKKFSLVVKETLLCFGGYLLGFGVIFCIILMQHGISSYIAMLQSLFGMSAKVTSYTPGGMITEVIKDYIENLKWFVGMVLGILAGGVGFRLWKGKWEPLKKIGYVLCILVLFRLYYAKGMFNIKYYTYESMFSWVAVFLMISIVVYVWTVFRKKASESDKLLAFLLLLMIAITPLGSNNGIYPTVNFMFLCIPFTIWLVTKEWQTWIFPVKAMLTAVLIALFIQSVGFGTTFVFRDGTQGEKRDTKIVNNDILKGMYTSATRAKAIEELTDFAETSQYANQNKEVLLYGNIPSVSYFLDLPPAIWTTWPDLESNELMLLEQELNRLAAEDSRPVVIVSKEIGTYMEVSQTGVKGDLGADAEIDKISCLEDFLRVGNYQMVFENELFFALD